MAGRPRTTLKRIDEWQKLADQLDREILHVMPRAYFDYYIRVERKEYEDAWGLVDLSKVPNLDRVAYEWSLVQQCASELADNLRELGLAIRKRCEGKGLSLNTSAALNPSPEAAADDSGEPDPRVDAVEPLGS